MAEMMMMTAPARSRERDDDDDGEEDEEDEDRARERRRNNGGERDIADRENDVSHENGGEDDDDDDDDDPDEGDEDCETRRGSPPDTRRGAREGGGDAAQDRGQHQDEEGDAQDRNLGSRKSSSKDSKSGKRAKRNKQGTCSRRKSRSELTPESWRARRKSSGSGRKLKKSASAEELREVDGRMYEGTWHEDKLVGIGIMRDKYGEYEGEFNDELASEGKGTKTFVNGDWHTGLYQSGGFHGSGTYVYKNGDRFDGVFSNNQLASGVFRWIEGHVYAGTFRDGVPDGEGSKRLADGRQYRGAWRAGKAHGWGVRLYPNGDCHEGMYQDDKRHGFGRYRWHDGEQVDGFWVEGKLQGRVRRVFANKDVVTCTARDNRFAGLGVRRSADYPSGCYVGFLDDEGLPQGLGCANEIFQRSQRFLGSYSQTRTISGFGIKDYSYGTFFAGMFVNSVPHGFGVFHWPDGTVHRGHWQFGKQHGPGRIEYASARRVSTQGTWINGTLNGACVTELVTVDGLIWHYASIWASGVRISLAAGQPASTRLSGAASTSVESLEIQDLTGADPSAAPQFPDDTLAHAMVPNFDPFSLTPVVSPLLRQVLYEIQP